MTEINRNFRKFPGLYLYSRIAERTKAFREANPGVALIGLGIGNTTEPITKAVLAGLKRGAAKLGNAKTYTGYGDEQGDMRLRAALAERYAAHGVALNASDIFISDGAKPDTANIQQLFDAKSVIAVQDPVYPVYVDSNVIAGRAGAFKDGAYEGVVYMPCTKENGFFPELPAEADVIYLCSPNNPTGGVATKAQLTRFVEYARRKKAVIIFDAAYADFIRDPALPRSIYEIEGAKECAIEISSFSKSHGFTGIRLGWSIVPRMLTVSGSEPGELNRMWNRRQTTMFNGASNIAQEGGLAALTSAGLRESRTLTDYYLENARIVREAFTGIGLVVHGGDNAPYLWVQAPADLGSWEFFDRILERAHVIVTPGSGFGPRGEGYVRISAFAHRNDVKAAVESIKKNLAL